MYYIRPSLKESLIPDRRLVTLGVESLTSCHYLFALLCELLLALLLCYEVHLVDQAEDIRVGRELLQRLQTVLIILQIFLPVATRHFKYINQHPYTREDLFSLRLEILLHELVLTTLVTHPHPPQSHKLSTRLPRNRTREWFTSTV